VGEMSSRTEGGAKELDGGFFTASAKA